MHSQGQDVGFISKIIFFWDRTVIHSQFGLGRQSKLVNLRDYELKVKSRPYIVNHSNKEFQEFFAGFSNSLGNVFDNQVQYCIYCIEQDFGIIGIMSEKLLLQNSWVTKNSFNLEGDLQLGYAWLRRRRKVRLCRVLLIILRHTSIRRMNQKPRQLWQLLLKRWQPG